MKTADVQDIFQAVPAPSLVAQVRDQILRAITRGELLPGERLVEGEIALRLGVSRGPVREAARLLQQGGLVVSHARRGFFVRTIEAKEIVDLYELREWIEVAAVRAAAERLTVRDIEDLRQRHKKIVNLARSGSVPDLIEAIIDFHMAICALSGNERVVRLFGEVCVEVRQILSVLGVARDGRERPIEVQGSLLAALEARDGDRAAREMRRYVLEAKAEVMEHYRHRGDYEAEINTPGAGRVS